MMNLTHLLAALSCLVIAYLLSSVNTAIIITKFLRQEDIRAMGSGNAGMTNVLRNLGKGPAAVTFIGDFLKGVLSVVIARVILQAAVGQVPVLVLYLVAVVAVLGHGFPIYYHFKGGKGIVVALGSLMAISPIPALISFGVFGICVKRTKIVSVGSIGACITFPIVTMVYGLCLQHTTVWTETLLGAVISGFIIYLHRANIQRLLRGEEHSFQKK